MFFLVTIDVYGMLCLEFRELIFDLYIERFYGFSLVIIDYSYASCTSNWIGI